MGRRQGWRVGELARAAGVSVRALHHYDAIGLLTPSSRTDAGHRLYTAEDVIRLYKILALRRLALSLDQAAAILDEPQAQFDAIVRAQLQQVEQHLEQQALLRARLRAILTTLAKHEAPTTDALFEVLEAMKMFERYYTPEQLARLEERRTEIGEDAIKHAEQEWATLIEDVQTAQRDGLDPADERMQELAGHWRSLVAQFTGGDPGIARSLRRMYENEGASTASRGMVSPELMEYVGKAIAAAGGW